MDYEISIPEGAAFVLIKVMQPMTSELGRQCGVEAARLAKEKNKNSFIFDLRQSQNKQPTVDNYEFAHRDISDFGFSRTSPAALLVALDDKTHNFIETAFLNAGYNVKIFTDESAAISWIEARGTSR